MFRVGQVSNFSRESVTAYPKWKRQQEACVFLVHYETMLAHKVNGARQTALAGFVTQLMRSLTRLGRQVISDRIT